MTRDFGENRRVQGDGSEEVVAQQQQVDQIQQQRIRVMQQQSMCQQLEIERRDQQSNGGPVPTIRKLPATQEQTLHEDPIDQAMRGYALARHLLAQQQQPQQQAHNARLQAQQQHGAAQEQQLPQDQQSSVHQRTQRQRPGQPSQDLQDMQQSEPRMRSDLADGSRAALATLMAKRLALSQDGHETHDSRRPSDSLDPKMEHSEKSTAPVDLGSYTQPFLSYITDNPTVFHAVASVAERLESHGFKKLSERDSWTSKLTKGGKYFFERNGSSLIAFLVGKEYESGNGASVIASHIDALATRLKPIPTLSTKAGYVQLGVAPYAGALNNTWWDRDLGIGGRVLVKDSKTGKIQTKLVKLGWPIARIPTLAPHFGAAASLSHPNKETEMVPIIGLDSADPKEGASNKPRKLSAVGGAGTFTATQPERLVKAIAGEMNIEDYSTIVNWELELFDTQPAQLGGLDKEFIFAGRVDDKLCSFAAIEALIASSETPGPGSSAIRIVGCFDDEEIGSLLRQGAHSNLLPSTLERICEAFSEKSCGANVTSQMYANSFLISADVSHAVNPNFMGAYLENHSPRLNTGVAVQADPNGHTTTDSVSTAFLQRVADKCGAKLQVFQIRNDSRSGGTVGPMLSSAMGMRAIDAGLPQLSMHSIRATIGSLDPGIGVQLFKGFFDHFEEVDAEFR